MASHRVRLNAVWLSITVVLLSAVIILACDSNPILPAGRILLPLRVCAVRGADLTYQNGTPSTTGNDQLDRYVTQAIADVNNKVWIPGANMSFFQTLYQTSGGPAFNTPVIDDPQPPDPNRPLDYTTVGPGQLGDIYVSLRETTEMRQAYQSCVAAWSLGQNAQKSGIIVILARYLVQSLGVPSSSLGVNPGHSSTLLRNGGTDLCVEPRHLILDDVGHQYAIVAEARQMSEQGGGPFYQVLAHELGHTLLLSHGDGQNNGGTLPPNPGPRKFDQDCGGTNTGLSLMTPGGGSDLVTPLQAELAREAAQLVPGHTGPV